MNGATILHLVAATDEAGVADAEGRGWERIGAYRFAGQDRDNPLMRYDVRVVRRMSDLHLGGGETLLLKGRDYEDGPDPARDPISARRWVGERGEKAGFDRLIEAGRARWFDPDASVAVVPEPEPAEF
jgi:hypothetical protein